MIASSSRVPATAWFQNADTLAATSAWLIVFSSSAPRAAPYTVPLPPKIATPPTTTAAMTFSS